MCILEKENLTMEELMDYLVKRESQDVINMNRVKKFYNDDNSFDLLMNKIINKDAIRFEKIINKTQNIPSPSKIFYIILDIVLCDGEEIESFDTLTKTLPSYSLQYHGWTFSWVHGEGTLILIYNRNNELIYQI